MEPAVVSHVATFPSYYLSPKDFQVVIAQLQSRLEWGPTYIPAKHGEKEMTWVAEPLNHMNSTSFDGED